MWNWIKCWFKKTESIDAKLTLQCLMDVIPTHVFWYNPEGILQGCSEAEARAFGYKNAQQMIGTSIYKQKTQTSANLDILKRVNQRILETGETQIAEEPLTYADGREAVFLSRKVPLKNSAGKIVSILGVAVDITDQKLREKLEIEKNVATLKTLEAREKYKKQAEKAAHDIRSPLLGLNMILSGIDSKVIPEAKRLAINDALAAVDVIMEDLVNYDKKGTETSAASAEKPMAVLVPALLSQVLALKKSEYKSLSLDLEDQFSGKDYTAFIQIEPTALKRSLSNLINNAKDAFEGRSGVIRLKLETSPSQIRILIQDNGKGMPESVKEKILKQVAVSSDKASGHGFGMAQVQETLVRNRGTLEIESEMGKGTTMIMVLPRLKVPNWFAENLTIKSTDTVVILDDDASMHEGWESRFRAIMDQHPGIHLKHFYEGEATVNFIKGSSDAEKSQLLLLTDYELLGQTLNGLDVIEQSGLRRAFLVSSHYANPEVQARAMQLSVKIIPKQTAVEIAFKVEDSPAKDLQRVDLVMVEDDRFLFESMRGFFGEKTVDHYLHPDDFLKHLSTYPKDTKITLDNTFSGSDYDGLSLAKILHEQGYSKLFIFSGKDFRGEAVPDYVTLISKAERPAALRKKLFPEEG